MQNTRSLTLVLRALSEDTSAARYGYAIHQSTGLTSGSVYPILRRLQESGLLVSAWERPGKGRPPRRYYQFTGKGKKTARELLQQEVDALDIQA